MAAASGSGRRRGHPSRRDGQRPQGEDPTHRLSVRAHQQEPGCQDQEAHCRFPIGDSWTSTGYFVPRRQGNRTEAPTVPQLGLHLGLSIAASKKWPGDVFDVSAAFLRGDDMIEEVYSRPPRESLLGVPPGSLIKAKKGIFGLRVL